MARCEAFVAPATPALSKSVVRATDVEMFSGGRKAAPKKARDAHPALRTYTTRNAGAVRGPKACELCHT